MKQLIVYFFKNNVEKNTQNKKPFKYEATNYTT